MLGLPLFFSLFPHSIGAVFSGSNHVYLPLLRNDVLSDEQASWGTPIALAPSGKQIWVVNPDAGSLTILDTQSLQKLAEIPVGQEPWALALTPDGKAVYVVDRALGIVTSVDAHAYNVITSIPVGPEPGMAALSPSGALLYVTIFSADEVVVIRTDDLQIVTHIPVETKPYGIAVTDNGNSDDADEKIYVTHFQAFPRLGAGPPADQSQEGYVSVIETKTHAVIGQIVLSPDENGFPNLMNGVALTGARAWVPHVRVAPDLPNGLTTTVFAAVASLDLTLNTEDIPARLRLNDQEIFGSPVNNPLAAIPSPDGETLYIVLAGSDLIEIVNIATPHQPQLVKFLPAGKNPRGMTLSTDGKIGYVMSYLSRAVTVIHLETFETIAMIPVTNETLQPDVLQGKILFNNAADPRLSQGSWMSCASCHPDGGSDGVTWMFPDGPRQSPPLWNAVQTFPWHWSAALDEAQDVEGTIELIQHGLGLAPGVDPAQLGSPNAGRSAALDALATFLAQGIRIPSPPSPETDPSAGRLLFQTAGCPACHGGGNWTSSGLPGLAGTLDPDGNGMVDEVLRNVGTLNPLDLRGSTGFDPPSLMGVGLTAPYFHDGTALTLEALLATGHPNPTGAGNGLTPDQITTLAVFLRTIGPATPPIFDEP